ncbi:hypothetical protein [Lentibacillus salinarum]|uniref:Uncharacterized protein n=1 Tax=Lentibacillus salinarum TaxID=446820 RepID=A0ABW3ZNX1_9BACI
MVPISINEFAKSFVKTNKEENLQDTKEKLQLAVENKKGGADCTSCDAPIWAIGSAIVGWNGCFTCITGEGDSSEDYEIDVVNY